jgi:hypothetical protein
MDSNITVEPVASMFSLNPEGGQTFQKTEHLFLYRPVTIVWDTLRTHVPKTGFVSIISFLYGC